MTLPRNSTKDWVFELSRVFLVRAFGNCTVTGTPSFHKSQNSLSQPIQGEEGEELALRTMQLVRRV